MTGTLAVRYYIAFQLRVSNIFVALTEKYYHHYKKGEDVMKLIHIFAIGLMAVTTLTADYTTIVTKTTPSMQGEKEIFFGRVSDYSNYVTEISKNIAAHGTLGAVDGMSKGAQALARGFYGEGLTYAGAGAAIGIVVGLLDPYVMSMYADQEYMLVRTDGKGELESILFIGDKHPSLSEAKIHTILQNK